MTTHALRRALAAVLLAGVTALSGCSTADPGEQLVVLGPWVDTPEPGEESDAFREVLDAYQAETGVRIDYRGTRAVVEALRSAVQNGTPPDVVIMPNVGELAYYAREGISREIDRHDGTPPQAASDGLAIDHRALWMVDGTGGGAYAVAVKTDLKSAIWYRPDAVPPGEPPPTWAAFTALTERLAKDDPGRKPLCLGMSASAAPGWPGGDWIEDILLHQAGAKAYQEWVSGEMKWTEKPVEEAWRTWARLLASRPGTASAPRGSLLTPYEQQAGALLRGECALYHQGSFVLRDYRELQAGGYDFFPFPAATLDGGIEVGADFAALFSGRPAAAELLAHLTSTAGRTAWVRTSGGTIFGPELDPTDPHYTDTVSRRVAGQLVAGRLLCLDASDAMPATLSAAFHQAVLEQIADPAADPLPLLRRLDTIAGTTGEQLHMVCTD